MMMVHFSTVCQHCYMFGLVEPIVIGVAAFIAQENVKTKHPQLYYESKLYMLLQGGSKLMP